MPYPRDNNRNSGYGEYSGAPRQYRTMSETGVRRNGYDNNRSWRRDEQPVPEPIVEVEFDPTGKKCMVFNGHYYDYAKIVSLGGFGPNALVENTNLHERGLDFITINFERKPEDDKHAVIVLPYEGKLVVLVGMDKVKTDLAGGKPVKARLLSKVAAKKAMLGDVK